MKNTIDKPAAFVLAFALSLTIHFIALAGIRGFRAPDPSSPNIFVTSLEREKVHVLSSKASIKDLLQKGRRNDRGTTLEGPSDGEINERPDSESPDSVTSLENGEDATGSEDTQETLAKDEESRKDEVVKNDIEKSSPLRSEEKAAEREKTFKERLIYDLYWLGLYVGRATLEAVVSGNVVTITSQAHSAAFISNFYKVEDYSESRIVDGMAVSFKIRQHEGKYRSDKETSFDLRSRRLTYFDHLKDIKREHELSQPVLWDVVSGFYHLRTQDLEVGKTVFIDVFDSDKFLSVEVDVLRKEKVEVSEKGEIDTVVVRPVLKSEGLFQKKGDVLIWLTDDGYKIPVRVETEVPVGMVVAKLKGREIEGGGASPTRMLAADFSPEGR